MQFSLKSQVRFGKQYEIIGIPQLGWIAVVIVGKGKSNPGITIAIAPGFIRMK